MRASRGILQAAPCTGRRSDAEQHWQIEDNFLEGNWGECSQCTCVKEAKDLSQGKSYAGFAVFSHKKQIWRKVLGRRSIQLHRTCRGQEKVEDLQAFESWE